METLTSLLAQYGLALVFASAFIEQIGAPIPAIPLLIVAGALAADGRLDALSVFAAAFAGCLAGDILWYAAGRRWGHRVLKLLCRFSLSPDSCVRQTENFFGRWGVGALTVAKFIPGLSTVAPPIAGAMGLKTAPFLVFNGIGAALWAGSAIAAGWLLSAQIDVAIKGLARMGGYAALLVAGLLAAWIAWKWWDRRRFLASLRAARISVEELYALIEQGRDPVVLDVRSAVARAADARRIPGALFIDAAQPERHLEGVPRDREIIVYCT